VPKRYLGNVWGIVRVKGMQGLCSSFSEDETFTGKARRYGQTRQNRAIGPYSTFEFQVSTFDRCEAWEYYSARARQLTPNQGPILMKLGLLAGCQD